MITLKFAGKCKECGSKLEVGEKAKWYGKGIVYGLSCHGQSQKVDENGRIGWVANNNGVETYQNYNGRCEDAPCCGCCNC